MQASLRTRLLCCVTLFTIWPATAALAEPAAPRKLTPKEKAEARALYEEGLRHYNVAEYADAITAFKEAYLRSGDPKLLFNVAQSYRHVRTVNRFRIRPGELSAVPVDAETLEAATVTRQRRREGHRRPTRLPRDGRRYGEG
jgi:hypothetical protein